MTNTLYNVFPHNDVPFWGCNATVPHLDGQILKNDSDGMNRHFCAKVAESLWISGIVFLQPNRCQSTEENSKHQS